MHHLRCEEVIEDIFEVLFFVVRASKRFILVRHGVDVLVPFLALHQCSSVTNDD